MIDFSPHSLMQRRNKNMESLQSCISKLSIHQKELKQLQKESSIISKALNECKQNNNVITTEQIDSDRAKLGVQHKTSFGSEFSQLSMANTNKQYYLNCPENAFEESFNIGEKIGEGAHGIVKKCFHREANKQYAVKILKMEDEHFRSIKTNFFNIKQLKHNSIIKYKALYLSSKNRICHLVMEYLPFTKVRIGLEQNVLRYVLYRIFDALAFIHDKGMCHRDIKPQNIMHDPKSGLVKIIDFGVSKNMKLRGRYEEMLTNTGTYYYKAPQMFLGGGYTQKIDSWAVGITLFQLITGYTPFQSEYHSETINNILNNPVDFNSPEFGNFSSLVKDLISRLLKKNVAERLTCQQAKKHLWFVPHLNDIDLMQSAGFSLSNFRNKQQERIDLHWLLERRSSVKEMTELDPEAMSKDEKLTMKRWLSIINEDEKGQGVQEFKFDFVESEGEQQESTVRAMTSMQSLSASCDLAD